MISEKRRAELNRRKKELEDQRGELKKKAREHRDSLSLSEIDETTEQLRKLTYQIDDIMEELTEDEPTKRDSEHPTNMREDKIDKKNFRSSIEYRDAFYRSVAARRVAEGDAEIMAFGRREVTDMNGGSVSSGAEYLVPTTTIDKINSIMEQYGAVYAAVTKYRFTGNVSLPIGVVGEPEMDEEGIYDLKFSFEEVKIDQEAVIATVTVKNLLLRNSIDALESFIAEQLAKFIAVKCDMGVLYGDGESFKGILPALSPIKYSVVNWTLITAVLGSIRGVYAQKASWGMRWQTFCKKFLGMTATDGVPIIGTMPIITKVGDTWYILGQPVIMSDAFQEGDFAYGAFKDNYITNESQEMVIEADPSPEFKKDKTLWRGKVYTGGAPVLENEAFIYYVEDTDIAATPTAAPGAGSVAAGTDVVLACASPKAQIYFTLDGSTPTRGSQKYSTKNKPKITEACTLKAFAVVGGMADSAVLEAAYTITG